LLTSEDKDVIFIINVYGQVPASRPGVTDPGRLASLAALDNTWEIGPTLSFKPAQQHRLTAIGPGTLVGNFSGILKGELTSVGVEMYRS
jgi:hypothetical protein